MVFLLAAVYYSIYGPPSTCDINNNNDYNVDDDNNPQQQQQPTQQQRLAQSLQRGGSHLYQHAVLRCSPSSRTPVPETTITTMEDDVRPPGVARTSGSASSKDSRTTTATTTHGGAEEEEDDHAQEQPYDSSHNNINFNAAAKQEWIDAVFGRDFLNSSTASSTEGAATKPPQPSSSICGGTFQCIQCTIPAPTPASVAQQSSQAHQKVGVTVSRLSVGLYVQSVNGEAAWAGVEAGSVLVAINDLPVLAEPSQALLERLWQYEGVFLQQQQSQQESAENDSSLLDDSADVDRTTPAVASTVLCDPVALQFVRDHRVYTVVLLSNTPQQSQQQGGWGIQWAPAAPLPLIKRVAGRAAEAKVPAGTLVAAVVKDDDSNRNDNNFRHLDHVATALRLKEQHEQGRPVTLQLVVPPSESRASHVEPSQQPSVSPPQSLNRTATRTSTIASNTTASTKKKQPTHIDGVEIKFLPLGYAIGSLCHSDKNVYYESSPREADSGAAPALSLEDLAEAVASGRREAPVFGRPPPALLLQHQHAAKYPPCPELRSLLDVWDPLQSLVYCLRFQSCGYNEATLAEQLQSAAGVSQRKKTSVQQLYELTCSPTGVGMANAFLLQFISLICQPNIGDSNNDKSSNSSANELTSMLLKLSRRNEAFCQRLYFLLRSYISTFETSGPSLASSSGTEGDPRNLMALLNCLELLRFAEKELSGRTFSQSNSAGSQRTIAQQQNQQQQSDWTPFPERSTRQTRIAQTLGRVGSNSLETSIRGVVASVDQPTQTLDPMQQQQQQAPPSPVAVTPESPPTSAETTESPKKKKLFGSWASKKTSLPSKSKSPNLRRRPPHFINTSTTTISPTRTTAQPRSDAASLSQTPSTMYENMADFLTELDKICGTIERSLQKSFRQKIADWALQPWSAGKDAALAEVTADCRSSLEECSRGSRKMLLVNPVESSELLSSVDYDECYILPSANFPILLTFNVSERRCADDSIEGEERLYRTRIELLSLLQQQPDDGENDNECFNSFAVQCAVAGRISESGESTREGRSSSLHTWQDGGVLRFETRSALGAPQTVSLRLSGNSENFDKRGQFHSEVGFCWLDLSDQWKTCESFGRSVKRITTEIWPNSLAACSFDEHGDLPEEALHQIGKIQLELRVTTEAIDAEDDSPRKRLLLYKHNDDLRQEAFAIQFIKTCDEVLKASGLDMKLLTFQCTPVGTKRGFVEWIPGSVTLSEICHPFATNSKKTDGDEKNSPSIIKKASLSKYESLRRLGGQKGESLRRIAGGTVAGAQGSIANDPVQDYLRSVAFDPDAPYLIRRDVMDTYVKSCAGYGVITYILGVGDRHLDNLLLHTSGAFFHCDFSFILGSDPKKANMPMRITEAMVDGMGGRESDNYSKFLSLVGAAFLALRRPENVRVLLSMVRLMEASCLPDTSQNQTIEQAILGMRDRLRLNLSETQAVSYIEEAVEASLSNKIWIAVDAFHNLGKKF